MLRSSAELPLLRSRAHSARTKTSLSHARQVEHNLKYDKEYEGKTCIPLNRIDTICGVSETGMRMKAIDKWLQLIRACEVQLIE